MSAKTCPLCAEDIQAVAVLCRYCGASFVGPGGATSPAAAGPAHPVPASGMAITAFIFSLLWLAGIGAIVGLVLGYGSRRSIRAGSTSGGGLAIAAIVLGWIGLVPFLLGFFLWLTPRY